MKVSIASCDGCAMAVARRRRPRAPRRRDGEGVEVESGGRRSDRGGGKRKRRVREATEPCLLIRVVSMRVPFLWGICHSHSRSLRSSGPVARSYAESIRADRHLHSCCPSKMKTFTFLRSMDTAFIWGYIIIKALDHPTDPTFCVDLLLCPPHIFSFIPSPWHRSHLISLLSPFPYPSKLARGAGSNSTPEWH